MQKKESPDFRFPKVGISATGGSQNADHPSAICFLY